MPMNQIIFEIRTYKSAMKFLADLSPNADMWNTHPETWIFRGQRDAEWGLVPSAFRPNSWEQFRAIAGPTENWRNNHTRLIFETTTVRFFAQAADREGLLVPGFDESWLNDDALRQKLIGDIKNVFSRKQKFPPSPWRSLFGMAQHYGIPTRLLDWSESAKIAAYFAAVDAAELLANPLIGDGGFIAVWALNTNGLRAKFYNPELEERIVLVHAPWSSNPNLRAQKGLFTLHEQTLIQDDPPDFEPLEKVIQRVFTDDITKLNSPMLYCLRLSIKESDLLLSLLSNEGINAASIFPGYFGVAQSIREMRLHRKPANISST